jgi:ABC-type multidrug transport system fused ATPase/permease subunit
MALLRAGAALRQLPRMRSAPPSRFRPRAPRWRPPPRFCLRTLSSAPPPPSSQSPRLPGGEVEETAGETLRLRRLFELVAPERGLMGVAMAAQLVSAGSSLLFPLALGRIVDTVQMSAGGAGELDVLAAGLGAVFTVAGVSTVVRVSSLSLVGGRISRDLRKRLFASVLRQDTAFFDVRQSGELVNRLSNDVAAVSRTLTDNTAKLLRSGITGATSLGMVLYLSPALSATALMFFPPMIAFGALFGRRARRLSRELVDAYAGANQVASERIGAIRTVRLFGAEEFELQRYARRVDDTFGLGRKVAIADGVFAGGMFYAAQMSLLGVLYVGGGMVIDPAVDLSVGVLTSFAMYAVQLGVSVSSIGTAYGQLLKALGSGTRVFEVLDREPVTHTSTLDRQRAQDAYIKNDQHGDESAARAPAIPAGRVLPPGYDARVEFESVYFGYNADAQVAVAGEGNGKELLPLLRGVDFSVSPGEVCAVAGESGSGKSSLMSLLSRLYLPTTGSIRLGGVDLSELDLAWLRTQVVAVPQEPILFSGTIASNIRYGIPEHVGMYEVRDAARAAASHDMIMSLRDGYETLVGERGQGKLREERCAVGSGLFSPIFFHVRNNSNCALVSIASLRPKQV